MDLTEIKRLIREYYAQLHSILSFKPHSSLFCFCPISGQADEKAQARPPLALMRWSNYPRACLHVKSSSQPHSWTTIKTSSQSLSLLSDQIRRPTLLSSESLVMWVIKLHTILVCVWWWHQSWHPNQILNKGLGVYNTYKHTNYWNDLRTNKWIELYQ